MKQVCNSTDQEAPLHAGAPHIVQKWGGGQHLLPTVLRYVSFLDYTAEFLERTIITCHLHEGYSQKIAHTGNENFRKTHTHTHKGKQTGNMY
jgi:hypothetical protein